MRKIIVRIKGGKATIKVEGCTGESCASLTEGLEKKLGLKLTDEKTDDYYKEEDVEREHQKQSE